MKKHVLMIVCAVLFVFLLFPFADTMALTMKHDKLDRDIACLTSGGIFQIQAGDGKKCYEIYPHIDGHGKIMLYDYAKQDISFLGGNDKDSLDNPAWLPDLMGGMTPTVTSDNLIFFKFGGLPVPEANHPGYDSFILVCDKNGGDRRYIYLNPWQEFDTGEIILDGDDCYFIAKEYSMNYELKQCSLYKANIIEGTLEMVYDFPLNNVYSIVGCYNDGIVFQRGVPQGVDKDAQGHECIRFHNALDLFNLDEGRMITDVLTWENGELSYTIDKDSKLYYSHCNENAIYSINLDNLEKRIISANVLEGITDQIGVFISGRVWDNHISISSRDDSVKEQLYYDLHNNKVVSVNLNVNVYGGLERVMICDETDDSFFVKIGFNILPTTKESACGDKYDVDEIVYQYALISKDDYWKSKAIYRRFEDNVHYQ